eukprot:17246_6
MRWLQSNLGFPGSSTGAPGRRRQRSCIDWTVPSCFPCPTCRDETLFESKWMSERAKGKNGVCVRDNADYERESNATADDNKLS